MKTPRDYASDMGECGVEGTELFISDIQKDARAEECDCCKALLEGIADILHNPETQRSPIAAYGLTEDCQMRAAAKVLRHIATALIVRRKNILEGKV